MPPQVYGGFVPTLNKLGFMSMCPDAYTKAFIAFSATCRSPVADIGAAYGVATIPALESGARVIAVDVDERHLEILRHRVPRVCLDRLQTICAAFPEGLDFNDGSVGAFLLAGVLHFLSPDRLQEAARRLFSWLTREGKVFVTTASPYLGNWKAFMPEYEARKRAGDPWPGYITEMKKYGPPRWERIFSSMLLLDPDTLARVFGEAGFIVEESVFLGRPEFPADARMDGRENVGLIARKPSGIDACTDG